MTSDSRINRIVRAARNLRDATRVPVKCEDSDDEAREAWAELDAAIQDKDDAAIGSLAE